MHCLQVHTLVKGLEKIAASADIPMLVAGDFNSIPGSAAHSLLVKHSVDADHPVCQWMISASLARSAPRHKVQHISVPSLMVYS